MNKKLYNELKAKVERLEKQINGGKGSGNFGHAGRPGKIGGSAPEGTATGSSPDGNDKKTGSEKGALESVHTDTRGKYGDGFDILEDAKEYLVEKARDPYGGGLGETIALAYEADARDFLGLPSHEEEDEGAEMFMSDFVDLQDRLEEVIREKSWEDLENDLGAINIEEAIGFGLDKSGYKFATENAKLGQSGLSHDDAVRDLKSFIADFGISDHYGAIKAAEDGDLKTAWTNISYDMRDRLKDEYDYDPLREEYD